MTLASLRHMLSMLVKASSVGTTPGNFEIQDFSAMPTFDRKLNIGTPQNLTSNCYHFLNFKHVAAQMQSKVSQSLCAYLILDHPVASVCYVFLCKWVERCTS